MNPNNKHLVLITGMPGSGKTSLAQLFHSAGYQFLKMGDVIRDLAVEKGLDPTPGNLGSIAKEVREQGGEAEVARRCVEKMKGLDHPRFVVDGIRSIEEVKVFRAHSEAELMAIHASPSTRFERLKERGRSDDPKDWEEFSERDERELKFGAGSSIAMADHMVVNEGTLQDLEESFKSMIKRMKDL